MHTHLFFAQPENISPEVITLTGEEWHHCGHVLRKKAGDEIQVIDGQGGQYTIRLTTLNKNYAVGSIAGRQVLPRLSSKRILLGVGLLKGQHFEEVISAATALGVTDIYPVITHHAQKAQYNHARLLKQAISALKQSGQGYLPEINPAIRLEKWLEIASTAPCRIVAEVGESQPLWRVAHSLGEAASIALMIGPEGGFSHTEIESAKAGGFLPVNIFPRRLRSELAVVVMLTQIYTLIAMQEV